MAPGGHRPFWIPGFATDACRAWWTTPVTAARDPFLLLKDRAGRVDASRVVTDPTCSVVTLRAMLARLAPWILATPLVSATFAHAAPPPPATLAFTDLYQRPIGPRGLAPTDRLLALAGLRVELTGFVVRRGEPMSAPWILAPLPLALGDEDESLADDLPPTVVYLHVPDAGQVDTLQACRGAARVAGRLELGPFAEPDGRISYVRVHADATSCVP